MSTPVLEPKAVGRTVTSPALQRYPLTLGVNPWLLTASVMLPTFMEVLDTAIASVALPYIAGSLPASNSEATWVLTSYLVANAALLAFFCAAAVWLFKKPAHLETRARAH